MMMKKDHVSITKSTKDDAFMKNLRELLESTKLEVWMIPASSPVSSELNL